MKVIANTEMMVPGKLYQVKQKFTLYQIQSASDHRRISPHDDKTIVELKPGGTFLLTSVINKDWSTTLVTLYNGKFYITRFHTDINFYDLSNYVKEI